MLYRVPAPSYDIYKNKGYKEKKGDILVTFEENLARSQQIFIKRIEIYGGFVTFSCHN